MRRFIIILILIIVAFFLYRHFQADQIESKFNNTIYAPLQP